VPPVTIESVDIAGTRALPGGAEDGVRCGVLVRTVLPPAIVHVRAILAATPA